MRCGLDVIDGLLSMPESVTGEEADGLLDLRHLLRARDDAEKALRLFCDLRRRMEQRHYLALYRLRRWLETQIIGVVQSHEGAVPALVCLRLDFYCIEAVRRLCLCSAARQGVCLERPRLSFAFVPVPRPETVATQTRS